MSIYSVQSTNTLSSAGNAGFFSTTMQSAASYQTAMTSVADSEEPEQSSPRPRNSTPLMQLLSEHYLLPKSNGDEGGGGTNIEVLSVRFSGVLANYLSVFRILRISGIQSLSNTCIQLHGVNHRDLVS